MFKFLRHFTGAPRAQGPTMAQLYALNHVGTTFGVSLAQFEANPWAYLGRPAPEVQALWDRDHALLPGQAAVAARASGARVAAEPELRAVA